MSRRFHKIPIQLEEKKLDNVPKDNNENLKPLNHMFCLLKANTW